MKYFTYKIGDKVIRIRISDDDATISEITCNDAPLEVAEEEMERYVAVIFLALIQYQVEVIHDDESEIITLAPLTNKWKSPRQFIRCASSLKK